MRTRILTFTLLTAVLGIAIATSAQTKAPATSTKMVVYKTASCGCCKMWVDYMKKNGFDVEAKDVSSDEVRAVSKAAGLKEDGTSCHTAKVGNYIVEGHVPAEDIQRMLKEQPAIAGIAAPGMPQGSPGMEQGSKEPYDVITFTKDGKTAVYAKHR
jgi:hypothetical protein